MTMHLERGLTTLNTRVRKQKPTKAKIAKWKEQHKIHNKHMKQLGLHKHMLSFDDYVLYIHGKLKIKTETVINTPWHHTESTYRRETATDHIPSYISKGGFEPCTKKEPMQYTGERRLIGIATMHKSNMVPIFADDDDTTGKKQATEIATMRRN
jgi:hypothetical protein